VSDLLVGVLSALLATNSPVAISNLLHQRTGLSVPAPRPPDPADQALKALMELDDTVRGQIDDMLQDEERAKLTQPQVERLSARERILQKLAPVRKQYEDFIARYPTHARGRIAYGSFLNESGDEAGAVDQWTRAKELNPREPSAWNNLANYYGHNGQVTNAMVHYARAIELEPSESVYYHNLATLVYMFRGDASAFFKKDVPAVLDDAMALYRRALELDPNNFTLATDVAQSYYGLPQFRRGPSAATDPAFQHYTDEALAAWTNAMHIARDDIERQGVLIHYARLNINAGRVPPARAALGGVTNGMFAATRDNLARRLAQVELGGTNAPAAPGIPPRPSPPEAPAAKP
jgi:tetratricopeptide (TPR) repeat protein